MTLSNGENVQIKLRSLQEDTYSLQAILLKISIISVPQITPLDEGFLRRTSALETA